MTAETASRVPPYTNYLATMQLIATINAKTLDGNNIQSDAESANQRITVPNADIRPEDFKDNDDDD